MSPHKLNIGQLVSKVKTPTKFEKISVKNFSEKFELQYLAVQHCNISQYLAVRLKRYAIDSFEIFGHPECEQ